MAHLLAQTPETITKKNIVLSCFESLGLADGLPILKAVLYTSQSQGSTDKKLSWLFGKADSEDIRVLEDVLCRLYP